MNLGQLIGELSLGRSIEHLDDRIRQAVHRAGAAGLRIAELATILGLSERAICARLPFVSGVERAGNKLGQFVYSTAVIPRKDRL